MRNIVRIFQVLSIILKRLREFSEKNFRRVYQKPKVSYMIMWRKQKTYLRILSFQKRKF